MLDFNEEVFATFACDKCHSDMQPENMFEAAKVGFICGPCHTQWVDQAYEDLMTRVWRVDIS